MSLSNSCPPSSDNKRAIKTKSSRRRLEAEHYQVALSTTKAAAVPRQGGGAAMTEAPRAEVYGAGAAGSPGGAAADVMISYSHKDVEFMLKLKGSLEESGVKVWVDKNLEVGVDFLNRIGQAIIEAKVFISLLSVDSLQSRFCQDELALAYVYDKPIYPVARLVQSDLFPLMDTGMKLQLARYDWFYFLDEDNYHNDCDMLVQSMAATIDTINRDAAHPDIQEEEEDEEGEEEKKKEGDQEEDAQEGWMADSEHPPGEDGHVSAEEAASEKTQRKKNKGQQRRVMRSSSVDEVRARSARHRRRLNRAASSSNIIAGGGDVFTMTQRQNSGGGSRPGLAVVNRDAPCNREENLKTFWSRYFQVEHTVKWDRFSEVFLQEYADEISALIADKDRQWMLDTLCRELEVRRNGMQVTINSYNEFCCADGVLFPFWYRVQETLVESYAMKEVFNVDSSVRMDAIQSLGMFKSPAVVEALFDLLEDSDPNARAIAAISLAKTGRKSRKIREKLLTSLKDEDRLVRESTCIALGYQKDKAAVPALVELWRNDMISSVRDAAVAALTQIGGDEAERAIHMTEVLVKEIQQLAELVRAQSVPAGPAAAADTGAAGN